MQDKENQQLNSHPRPEVLLSGREPYLLGQLKFAFFNSRGLRAGWRFLLFLILIRIVFLPLAFILLRPVRKSLGSHAADLVELILLLGVLATTYLMARLEHRSFFDYGLGDKTPISHWLAGVATGFVSLTLMLTTLRLGHYFEFGPQFMHGRALLVAAMTNLFLFAMVALFEETAFRGYALHTLADGLRFWPAAIVISLLFAYVHVANPGEAPVGIAAVFVFGMMLAFSVWRTGSLLWAIGFHFMWDYSETFIYGVPDSGFVSPQHLLSAKFSGPAWITGGTVGPEGSAFIFLVLAAVALVLHWAYPRRQFAFAQSGDRPLHPPDPVFPSPDLPIPR